VTRFRDRRRIGFLLFLFSNFELPSEWSFIAQKALTLWNCYNVFK